MPLPYKIAALLYGFNARDGVRLLGRGQEPNRGCWSPPGGKLHTDEGESPYACACREAQEELGLRLQPAELHFELPNFIELKVVDADPGVRGDTASGGTKPATVETGAIIKVPLYLEVGTVIKIDTRTRSYVERVR